MRFFTRLATVAMASAPTFIAALALGTGTLAAQTSPDTWEVLAPVTATFNIGGVDYSNTVKAGQGSELVATDDGALIMFSGNTGSSATKNRLYRYTSSTGTWRVISDLLASSDDCSMACMPGTNAVFMAIPYPVKLYS